MMKPTPRFIGALAGLLLAAPVLALPALAASPQPAKPVPAQLYSGRWYEIARTPNKMQGDCQGGTNDFSGWKATGEFSIVETCHHGSAAGPVQTYNANGHILPASGNAKMKLAMLGGLITQEYWIVDHADNGAWAIMDRSDGRYVWLLSRQPVLDAAERGVAFARLRQLGFDLNHLAYSQPAK